MKKDRTLIVITAVALLMRLAASIITEKPIDPGNMAFYMGSALHGSFSIIQAPIYPFILHASFSVFGNMNFAPVFVFQALISTVTLIFIWYTASAVFGRRTAVITTSVFAVHPNFIIYNLMVMPLAIEVLVVTAAMAVAVSGIEEGRRSSALAVITGIGILTMPKMVFLVPGMLLICRKRLLFLSVLTCVVLPWTVRNWIAFKTLVPLYDQKAYELDLARLFGSGGRWHSVLRIYGNMAGALGNGWGQDAGPALKGVRGSVTLMRNYIYMVTAVWGAFAMVRYGRRKHAMILLPVLGFTGLTILFSYYHAIYRVTLEPLLIMYISVMAGKRWKKEPLLETKT